MLRIGGAMRAPLADGESLRLPLGPRSAHGASWVTVVLAAGLVACAIVAAVGPWAPWARTTVALALIVLAALVQQARGRRHRPTHGWLVVDGGGVHRVDGAKPAILADFGEPFGVTVFADADRSNFLFAFTSPSEARYLPARVRDGEDATLAASVVERAVTAAESDLRGGDESALSVASAETLLAEVFRRAPAALDRLYLSDATGDPVMLDRSELLVGSRRIDLSAPLEWRASVFQERGVHTTSVSQATWVRQADVEVVLVAPVPAEGGWLRGVEGAPSRPRSSLSEATRDVIARDLRLMQASAGEPPPRELRRAIDRMFMLPLRRALDRAPRISRVDAPRPRPEGRP
jgi:hypothetical protein